MRRNAKSTVKSDDIKRNMDDQKLLYSTAGIGTEIFELLIFLIYSCYSVEENLSFQNFLMFLARKDFLQ
jgi:hypothetical protein